MRGNSGIIGPKQELQLYVNSGVHGIYDQYTAEVTGDVWTKKQIDSISSDNGTTLNEETNNTFTVNTAGYGSNSPLYYRIQTVSGTAVDAADFSGGLTGLFYINNNTGSFVISPVGDGLSESNVVKIQIISWHVAGIDYGQVLIETEDLTIGDAAVSTGQDITSSFYEISRRFINSGSFMGNSSDYTGGYDVSEVQTDFANSAAAYGRIYLGIKVTAATTFYNDISVAGIQILDSTRTNLLQSWIFNTSSGGSGSSWQTTYSAIYGTSATGFPTTPATAKNYSYTNMSTSTNINRWSWSTGTGSSYTGTADGISNSYYSGGTIATVGDATVSQSSNTYYAFRETSGSTRYSGAVMRSPLYYFQGQEWIRVIHAVAGYGAVAMDPNDSLYIGVYSN